MVITRRQLTAALGYGMAALPPAGRAQQPTVPVIGILNSANLLSNDRLSAFSQGLADVDFALGRNVSIEFRFGNGDHDRLRELAAELIKLGVAVIVANGVSLSAAM